MKNIKHNRYIISLGGSLIAPDQIDAQFLRNFRKLIFVQSNKGKKFLILPGGGSTARKYQKAAKEIADVADTGLDWIGIDVNRFHAQWLTWIFGAEKYVPVSNYGNFSWPKNSRIVVATGGIKPGGSSDSTSVVYALKLGIKTIINLTNVTGVYNKDPKKFKTARLIGTMTWKEFRAQFGTSRKPGQHKPFDPSVSKIAKKFGIRIVILNGRDLKNLENYLEGKPFKGTTIS